MSKKLIILVVLVIYSVLIMLPPIIHGYIYPNIGDDTAAHMNIFDKIEIGKPIPTYYEDTNIREVRYFAYYIVGYPMDVLHKMLGIDKDTLFFWFNYLAFLGVGVSLFFIFKSLIGFPAGLLALFIPTFASNSFLLLFYSGVIFEIINIGIIFLFACYFTIKWLMGKKKRYAFGAIILFCLFAVFHSTGVYLPFFAVVGYMAFIVYKIMTKQPISKLSILCGVVGVLCGFVLFRFNPIVEAVLYSTSSMQGISGFPLLQESLLHYMSMFVLVILIVAILCLVGKSKEILVAEKLAIAVFGLSAMIMLPAILFSWSPQPFRQGYDFAIFLSMVAVILMGVVIRLEKQHFVKFLLVGVVVGGVAINIFGWFGYNSALEKVDIEAINYVNTLDGEYYSCSDNIDHWVYSRYVDKDFMYSQGTILITRNVPMKSKVALVEEGDLTSGRMLLNQFIDGEVEITIYR